MKVFLYEHMTAQAARGSAALDALSAEGWAMFTAVRDDLQQQAGIELLTLPLGNPDEQSAFCELARAADYSLIIAPESEGELERRCRWVEQSSGRLLGPDSGAVALTADKLATFHHLRHCGVPTVPTWRATAMPDELAYPYILKPRHGAGSQATYRVDDSQTGEHIWRLNEITPHDCIVQPFIAGLAASIALLIGPAQQVALPPTEQLLSADGRFHYEGGRLRLSLDLAHRAEKLGRQTVAAIPGLWGYVGVDLILGNTVADDYVIEVNPRLTTSYVGLRALALDNLMEITLRIVEGQPVPEVRWRSGGVTFRADGGVQLE